MSRRSTCSTASSKLISDARILEGNMRIIGVSGFPCVGKSTFTKDITRHFNHCDSHMIGTEAYISSREDRKRKGLGGCALVAYDTGRLCDDIRAMRKYQPIHIPVYSWHEGKHVGQTRCLSPSKDTRIIIDGSVVCHETIATQLDAVLFIVPGDLDQWLDFAISRDVRERNYCQEEARRQNIGKVANICHLCNGSMNWITQSVVCTILTSGDNVQFCYSAVSLHSWKRVLESWVSWVDALRESA